MGLIVSGHVSLLWVITGNTLVKDFGIDTLRATRNYLITSPMLPYPFQSSLKNVLLDKKMSTVDTFWEMISHFLTPCCKPRQSGIFVQITQYFDKPVDYCRTFEETAIIPACYAFFFCLVTFVGNNHFDVVFHYISHGTFICLTSEPADSVFLGYSVISSYVCLDKATTAYDMLSCRAFLMALPISPFIIILIS